MLPVFDSGLRPLLSSPRPNPAATEPSAVPVAAEIMKAALYRDRAPFIHPRLEFAGFGCSQINKEENWSACSISMGYPLTELPISQIQSWDILGQDDVVKLMKFIAAYLLAVLGGNSSPSAEDLTAILEPVGCELDNEKIELLLSQLSGKDITELIAAGREKFASVPCGGGVAVAAGAPAAGGAGAAPAAEAKKEEKVEEKEESDDDMGFSLFD
ncbi:hypothetical protein ACP4OV_016977 [Aristida adscensionis]